MDDSLEDLGEDFYDNDYHDGEEHNDVGDDHHDEYENNFGGDVYGDDHPENNPYEEEMYHPSEAEYQEEQPPQDTYQYEQTNEEEQQPEYEEEATEHFENYEEEQYEEPTVDQAENAEEQQHEENDGENEVHHDEDSQFEDFDPYGSYENQEAQEETNEEADIQETHQEPIIEEQRSEPVQLNQEEITTSKMNISSSQEPKSIIRERPKSASRVQEKVAEKRKPTSRPSSTEKKKPFTTVEEYVYKPYYENRQKFYDENEIREYMKEKRRKEKEKLKMKPPRNNSTRKKPYDEEKVKEFMKKKQDSDRKLAEQKKQEEIQKKIGKKDALKRLDEYIHELFTNPPPPPEEEKTPKKKKPEMPQFLKDQLEENTDGRKRVKEFGKKVRSKLAVDHEKKKKLKAAAEELARELRRRNLHRIKQDSPPNAFSEAETESTNSSVWSLWSAPPKPVDNNSDYSKGKSEKRDFSFPTPKHVDCTYNDISSIEPQLTEAEIERRKIIDNALLLISSARKAKEEVSVKPINTTPAAVVETRAETSSVLSSGEKPVSNRMLPQFPTKERKKSSPEKEKIELQNKVDSPTLELEPELNTKNQSSMNIRTNEIPVSPHFDNISETAPSSPSVVYSEYSIKSDRSSLYPFTSQLKRNDSETSSLDNSNLDPIVITLESSKQKYFNPVEYETFHNSNKNLIENSELSEGTTSESSIIVDSSSENSIDEIDNIHEYASFNPTTTIFNDDLIKKDNRKEIELHFSTSKERKIPNDQNFNYYSIDMEPSPSLSLLASSSEFEKISYFSKNSVKEQGEKTFEREVRASSRRKKEKNPTILNDELRRDKKSKPLRQSYSSVSSLRTSSDYGKDVKSKSKTTSNETSSISSDISSASLISIENDSETSALLEEVRKKKEEIKKQVFKSLKQHTKSDKMSSSYKRNKSKMVSGEIDPFNIISTIKAKNHSDIEQERRYKKEKIREEIKHYREYKPAGLEMVSNANYSKHCSTSCQTQTVPEKAERRVNRSIEVQTSTPVDIVYDSDDEIVEPQQDTSPPKVNMENIDTYLNHFHNPAYLAPEVDRLSPDELVERLLDSLQIYEKVFESDVRLTRLLASTSGGPFT